jgi:hypothetical protein
MGLAQCSTLEHMLLSSYIHLQELDRGETGKPSQLFSMKKISIELHRFFLIAWLASPPKLGG